MYFLFILSITLVYIKHGNCYKIPKPAEFCSTTLKSSFINIPHIREIIIDLSNQNQNQNQNRLQECDYKVITSAILAYYFHDITNNNNLWVTVPEYQSPQGENVRPDYTLMLVHINPFGLKIYAVIEVKSKSGDSWDKLLKQLYEQAERAINVSEVIGRVWVIGQKGFEICLFKFNSQKYKDQDPDLYTFFEPLNLNNFSQPQLDHLGIKYKTCNDNGFDRIALIKWRLDNINHIPYIHDMFEHMKRFNP